jgi:hypothetical protein
VPTAEVFPGDVWSTAWRCARVQVVDGRAELRLAFARSNHVLVARFLGTEAVGTATACKVVHTHT